jgi:hypothetical protein
MQGWATTACICDSQESQSIVPAAISTIDVAIPLSLAHIVFRPPARFGSLPPNPIQKKGFPLKISRLRVGNEDFLVSSMIERCPKSMMLRELVKNAIEAAINARAGGHRIEIAPRVIAGGRKLAIWNTGPGMDADELFRMCDIASSIGKENALDQNFGMGAKVASLPSNPHGIRYRSCKAGRVHQVIMGKRDEAYGRLHQVTEAGTLGEVMEVTEQAVADGRSLDMDWTEVVLLGTRDEHDTVADPFAGNPSMAPGWIAAELYSRFYALPPGISLLLSEECNSTGAPRAFVPIGARVGEFANYEAVPTDRGITLHYFYDAPDQERTGRLMSDRGALQPAQSSAALIYRGEIYDFRPGWAWLHEAPVYGIPFGARNFSVYIQLPDDFPLLPDGYRQFLRHTHNLQHHVQAREFAAMALRFRPAWLIELLRNFAPDARHTDHLKGEMAGLFRTLKVRRRWWPPGDGTPPPPGEGIEYEVAPQIVPLRDENDIRERGMEHKAARFYGETHQLFVNTTYSGFTAFRDLLEQEYAAFDDLEKMRLASMTITEQMLIRQVCRKLVFGLSKREVWHGWEVDQATSMYSLTLAADDNADLFATARDEMNRQLGIDKPPAPRPDPRIEDARLRFASAMEELLSLRSPQPGNQPLELLMRFG